MGYRSPGRRGDKRILLECQRCNVNMTRGLLEAVVSFEGWNIRLRGDEEILRLRDILQKF
jgi:hypothetical protein